MGEELDDGELLPRGREEGVEAGGVEVHGVVPLRGGLRPVADAERPEGVRAPREGGGDSTNEEEDSRHRGGHGIGKEMDLTGPVRRGSGDPSHHIRTSREEGRSPVGVVVGQRQDWSEPDWRLERTNWDFTCCRSIWEALIWAASLL